MSRDEYLRAGDNEGELWMLDEKNGERLMPPARVERYLARLQPEHAARVRARLAAAGIHVHDGVSPSALFAGESVRAIPSHVIANLRIQNLTKKPAPTPVVERPRSGTDG